MEIGNQIKALRQRRGITQEEMAQHFGITPQAVSKWERGAATPDIALLPDISAYFGVTIDELFALSDDTKLERIENMIWDVRFLSQEEFAVHEQFLKDCMKKEAIADRAVLLLATLYNKRAREYRDLAKPLAREALLRNPGKKDAHNAVFDAEDGPYMDWNTIHHHELIDFYKEVVKAHPEDVRNYFWLLDLLIADGRTAEAREYAEQMKQTAYSYHYEMYMGYICKAECDLPGALDWWQKMTEHSPEKWVVWAEYADCMAKLCRYDEAVQYYKKAMPMRPKPRFIDCEQAVSQICEIQGDIAGAIEMQQQMLSVTKEDWCTEGESIDSILREIARLEKKLQK